MNLKPETIYNLLGAFHIVVRKTVKKSVSPKPYITNEFVDDRFPELFWYITYEKIHSGWLNNIFDITSIEIKDKEGNIVFTSKEKTDSVCFDDIERDGVPLDPKYVRNISKSFHEATSKFLITYGESNE